MGHISLWEMFEPVCKYVYAGVHANVDFYIHMCEHTQAHEPGVQMCSLVYELVCRCVSNRMSLFLQGPAGRLPAGVSPDHIWALALGGVPGCPPPVTLPLPIAVAVYPDLLAPAAPVCQGKAAEEGEDTVRADGGHCGGRR